MKRRLGAELGAEQFTEPCTVLFPLLMTFAQYLASCVVSIVRCFLFSYRMVMAVGQATQHSKEGDIGRGGAEPALLLYIDRNALHIVCKAHALKATVRA